MPAYSDYKSYVTNNLLENDHDIHFKMSKKIAQLTKVVCMLNSRGEDSVDLLKETSKQHEDEIMKLKRSYELKLRNLELRLEEEKRFGDTITFLEKSINEKELEIINMESKCSQLINEHHLKEDMLKAKHNEEIIKMQQTFVEHKEKYEKELNTIQGFAEQWKSHQCPNVEPILNEKSQLECEFKRLQEKYSLLETEVEYRIKALTDSYECKIQEIIKNIKDEENRKENELLEINKNLLQDLKNQKYIYDQSIIKNNQEKNELSNFIKHNTEINLNNIWQGRLNQEREEFQIELSKLHKLNEEIKYNLENHIESSKLKYDKLNTEYINYQKKTNIEYEEFHQKIIDLQLIGENLKKELIIKNEEKMNLEKERNMKYLQLKKEYDECLEKLKITEAQLESKNENQLDKQNLILNSKYEDVQLKLKESRKLVKALENKSQLLRKQLSTEKSNFIHLKEDFRNKLQNLKQRFINYVLDIEQIKINLSHIIMILKQEIKIKYENYYQSLFNQKIIDLRKTLYNEIEQKINKEKESAIRNITVVKQNEIERLQQVNKELKSKLAKQSQEYENEIIEKKCNLEQVINKLTKEFEECQLTNKQIELKLVNECKKKENLEKQLIKLTNEMERMKNDYENLSKQAKEKKSSKFTELVSELDRKWSETVGRECARVRSETMQQLELQYKTKLEEITNNYEKTIRTINKQWEMKIELNKIDQFKNNIDQVTEYITKEQSSDHINQLSENLGKNLDQSVQTDEELENKIENNQIGNNEMKNIIMIDSSTETDQQSYIEQNNYHMDENEKIQKTKYEQEVKQKQIELEKAQVNYNKLLEEFVQYQSNFEQIHVKLKSELTNERLANEEKLSLKEEELHNHFKNELQTTKQYYENLRSKEYNEFMLAQNILKSKIHELHQRLLKCSCKSSTVLKQVKNSRFSANSQLLPEITMSNKQSSIFDTLSSSSLSPLSPTGALSESKFVYNHDYNLISDQLPSQINEDHRFMNENREEKFRLPSLAT
ncbi:unnamed protein product [Schistosoma rodhaini]|uniref:Protein FAM184A/B N-terminal domain-containing protein n=1 Tax=Schistosoma rodhaini TaxID=6188 RepID=A0AA85FW99_9TREM|nr:unnamed protein product [Schistosoma rodhaini]